MIWLLLIVGDAQRFRKAVPVKQPYIMLDWSRGWAAVPKTVVDGFESCIEHQMPPWCNGIKAYFATNEKAAGSSPVGGTKYDAQVVQRIECMTTDHMMGVRFLFWVPSKS